MGYNPHLNLSDYVFAGLMNLTDINIDSSNLETLPEHLFEGSVNLKSISLRTNIIKDLPDNIFEGLTKLEKLYLDENNLSKLPDRIFSSLKNLVELNLKGNSLTEINENMFAYTSKLKKLNLSNNKIANINNRAFLASTKLESLDLSYNQYKIVSPIVDINPFNPLNDLQSLNLSHNLIDDFPESIVPMLKLTSFDLNYNVIRYVRVASLLNLAGKLEIFLNHNNISVVDFSLMDAYVGASGDTDDDSHSTVVYISQNPIRCDCDNFMLTQYNYDKLDPIIKTLVDIRMNDLYCATPGFKTHSSNTATTLPFINCRKRNLTQPPALHLNTNQTLENIDVHLEENALQTGPDKGFGYENVTRLYLQNNQITDLDWIPSKIKKLNLSNNQLRNMGAKIMAILNTTEVENITLFGNPWSCDCSALSLQNYLRNHYNKVNINDVKCKNNKLLLDQKELCKTYTSIIYAIAVPILIIICAVAIAVAIYFYYKEQIKVWLYAKNLCLWFVTEEELDKDKTYDIFISYSHKDEDFLIQNLLPVLEAGPNPYKICIHVRDWIPGELIATQVTNSVLDSRRTLVVLSESFLESGWGKLEFRTAHTQAITEGRARVVVIKYGKINEEKLDDELKAYLKSNTYVEWGDPWFWNKLKYALPHYKRNKKYNNNQKHVNMMLKIDDKFELVNSSPTIHAESTPPVISLDPALLKNHPLNFNSTDSIATPPAEAPLMVKK
ncbi:hypothetical protein NQ317_008173 [Molorchus minor]|uniref:TIR domain-containing protein n=1 Tax=Molorchus minor TaxID=1323400 RepID=A0ABQ9J6Z1_9CUCU|nr:hypothetical protein NQ317_008173 [Molorchus minor]